MRDDHPPCAGRRHYGLLVGLIVVRLGRFFSVIKMTHVVRTAQWRRFLLMTFLTGGCVGGYPPVSYHPSRNGSLPPSHPSVDPYRRTDGATHKQSRKAHLLPLAPTGVWRIHSPAWASPARSPGQPAPEPPAPWGIPPPPPAAQPPPEPQAPPVSLTHSGACPKRSAPPGRLAHHARCPPMPCRPPRSSRRARSPPVDLGSSFTPPRPRAWTPPVVLSPALTPVPTRCLCRLPSFLRRGLSPSPPAHVARPPLPRLP